MSFNLVMPASIDLLHLILGGVAALFFILFLVKGAAQPKSESASTADKKPENTPEPDAAPAESAPDELQMKQACLLFVMRILGREL